MIEEWILALVADYGFAMAIALILLWDKIKSNGSLKRAVENNTEAIQHLHQRLDNHMEGQHAGRR